MPMMIKLSGSRQLLEALRWVLVFWEARYTDRTGWKMPGAASSRHSGIFGSMMCGACW